MLRRLLAAPCHCCSDSIVGLTRFCGWRLHLSSSRPPGLRHTHQAACDGRDHEMAAGIQRPVSRVPPAAVRRERCCTMQGVVGAVRVACHGEEHPRGCQGTELCLRCVFVGCVAVDCCTIASCIHWLSWFGRSTLPMLQSHVSRFQWYARIRITRLAQLVGESTEAVERILSGMVCVRDAEVSLLVVALVWSTFACMLAAAPSV